MKVAQIAQILNDITKEILGESVIVTEDLSNIVDLGTAVFNADAVDNYTKALVDHIGRMVFVDRVYNGYAPNVVMDSWTYGSVLEKVDAEMPEAEENQSWELTTGQSYDCHIFYGPEVKAKFYNSKTTFEVRMSFAESRARSAFSDAGQMSRFVAMIYTKIRNTITVKMDALTMRLINNMTGETLADEAPTGTYTGRTGIKAVNLLYKYNSTHYSQASDYLTVAQALENKEFLKFASAELKTYIDELRGMSTLYNIDGAARFTYSEDLHLVMLSRFVRAAEYYLDADTFHDTIVKMPGADIVPYWQANGQTPGFGTASEIDIKTASGATVHATGVVAVMFDRDALGITNKDSRVTSEYTAAAEFYTEWHKTDISFFNATDENFVVFYMA